LPAGGIDVFATAAAHIDNQVQGLKILSKGFYFAWVGLLVFAVVYGVVFDDVDFTRNTFGKVGELARVCEVVVEIFEDDVFKGDS